MQFIFNLHPPEPPATTGQTAAPRRPRPAVRHPARPENTPHRRSAAAPAIPLGPPVPSFFSGDPHATAPPPPATTAPTLNPKIGSGVPLGEPSSLLRLVLP